MALTLTTNPVDPESVKFFPGFQKCEVVFKREDLAITSVESGSGGIKINVSTDLTGYLNIGDALYLYSECDNYVYDGVGMILGITAGDITIDMTFIQTGTGGYINYLKKYYVELQCVDKLLPESNLLPFSLQSDGDSAGNINIDVSIINELNYQRGNIEQRLLTENSKEFQIKYREVYQGSSNSFTLVDGKIFVMVYAIDPIPLNDVLNQFDIPSIFLGYPGALTIAFKALTGGSTIELKYKELNINNELITNQSLGSQAADKNSLLMWEWSKDAIIQQQTKYIQFELANTSEFDFASPDFAYPDFKTE